MPDGPRLAYTGPREKVSSLEKMDAQFWGIVIVQQRHGHIPGGWPFNQKASEVLRDYSVADA